MKELKIQYASAVLYCAAKWLITKIDISFIHSVYGSLCSTSPFLESWLDN